MESIVVRPNEGRSISLGGMGVMFRLFGQDTAGSFAVVEHPMEPGRLTWPMSTLVRTNIPMSWRASSERGLATK